MADLLKALRHIHIVVGFYHRDVKIENLQYRCKTTAVNEYMQCFGDLVLFDLGLARFVEQEWDGGYAGTALYTAPEVLRELNTEDSCKGNTGGYSAAVDLWAAGLLLFAFLAGDFPYTEDDLWGGTASVDVSGLTKKAIQELDDRLTEERISVPRALLDGLLDADPAGRLDASAALQDPWLTGTKGTMTASRYSAAVKKSAASKDLGAKVRFSKDVEANEAAAKSCARKETKVRRNDARYYHEAVMKSSSSKETKVPTNDARYEAAEKFLKSLPDPSLEDYCNVAATKSSALEEKEVPKSEARYYNEAVMKGSASKETTVPTNFARYKAAEKYLKSLPDPAVEDDYYAAATKSCVLKEKEAPTNEARYYNEAVMKSSASKDTNCSGADAEPLLRLERMDRGPFLRRRREAIPLAAQRPAARPETQPLAPPSQARISPPALPLAVPPAARAQTVQPAVRPRNDPARRNSLRAILKKSNL